MEVTSHFYSFAHDAASEFFKNKAISTVGLAKVIPFSLGVKYLDDFNISNDDLRSIGGSVVFSTAGTSLASAGVIALGFTPIGATIFVGAAGLASGYAGGVLGENIDDIYEYAIERIFGDRANIDPKSMVPIGQVSSARLPGQHGLIHLGHENNALDVISELNAQRSFLSQILTPSVLGPGTLNPMRMPRPSIPLSYGHARGGTATPAMGEALSFPLGSPGYPASTAQRMRGGR